MSAKRSSRRSLIFLPLAAATLLIGAAACTTDNAPESETAAVATVQTTSTSSAVALLQNAPAAGASISDVVRAAGPSVVKVSVTGPARADRFGQAAQPEEGTGTGFIVSADGYIVTNNHVVTLDSGGTAGSIQVEFADGRVLDATIAGTDPRTDLAVLKVNATGLQPLRFAGPESIEVGQTVIAIGYALDLGATPTVTTGVVSATDRVIEEATTDISNAIQTDAAINPGNSGGPLLNLRGEVTGVNTAGLSGSMNQSVQGIFFAVSSEVAEPVVTQLMQDGRVDRGALGVSVQPASATSGANAAAQGVTVMSVSSGSPAAAAGIAAGDVITRVGEVAISNTGDLTNALTRYGSGARVTVELLRGSSKISVQVTLSEAVS